MNRIGILVVASLAFTLCSPSLGQSWQEQWTDNWGTPETEKHVAPGLPFEVSIEAVWSGGDTEIFDFELVIDLGAIANSNGERDVLAPLAYVADSFVPTSWLWGGWDFQVEVDASGETLTIVSSSPSIPWGHWIGNGQSLPFGTLQFVATELNTKDYGTGDRTPWQLSVPDGRLYTADDLSSFDSIVGPSIPLDIFTDGQRDLVPPVPAFGASTTRFAVSVGGKASVENTQYIEGGAESETDLEDLWFESAQAYRTTEIATAGSQIYSYGWSALAGEQNNAVFSLEANATMDSQLIYNEGSPDAPFTAHALAEIVPGNRLVMMQGTGGTYPAGTPMTVTVSVGLESQTTSPGPTSGTGLVDWMCDVRLDATNGVLLGTVSPGTETITFTATIGSSLYFEGYLDALATSSTWYYQPEMGLYVASGADALSKLDIWVNTSPSLVPGDLDDDGDVDLDDYTIFASCMAGPGASTLPGGCAQDDFDASDLDNDSDVDLQDFFGFQQLYGGN